ncbi:MAG: peptidoglycan DD-metalloendopeptidase family protein [Nevskia sp.]
MPTAPRVKKLAAVIATAALSVTMAGCFSSEPVRDPQGAVHRVSPAAKAPAAARPTYGETYVVARGDTLYSIAFRNQLDYHELADWNGIGRDYAIRVGQVLRLTPPEPLALQRDSGTPAAATAPRAAASAPRPPAALPSAAAAAPRAAPAARPPADGGSWEWPTRGRLLRGFDSAGNKGLDIGGEPGQIVIASRAGKVVYSGSALKGYGELIIIKHDEDYLSAYGYNRKRLVEEGDSVVGGQPIAELGLGPEQKPLLHFEIRDRGKPVDPKPLLPAR